MTEPTNLGLKPGLHYDIPEDAYHQDALCETPTLSRSEAVKLLEESPLHLWCSHPRLGNKTVRKPSAAMDFGSAGHAMILESGQDIIEVEAPNWVRKDAKEQREAIRENNQIPLLSKDYSRAIAVRNAFDVRLKEFSLFDKFYAGKSEVTLLNEEEKGVFCRVRLDKLSIFEKEGSAIIFDPKMTASANPTQLPKQVMNMGYAVQEQFYIHALEKLRPDLGGRIRFIYLPIEIEYPFAMAPFELNGEFKAIGVSKALRAIASWKRHMDSGNWPGYVTEILKLEPPSWALLQEMGAPTDT